VSKAARGISAITAIRAWNLCHDLLAILATAAVKAAVGDWQNAISSRALTWTSNAGRRYAGIGACIRTRRGVEHSIGDNIPRMRVCSGIARDVLGIAIASCDQKEAAGCKSAFH